MTFRSFPVIIAPPAPSLTQDAILDPAHAADFDRVTRVAARALDVTAAQFNVVTRDGQVSVSSVGPGTWRGRRAVGHDASYCVHVVRTGVPLVVEDARAHPLVRENRATTEGGIGAYLGVPVVLEGGTVAGSLCVVELAPRAWTAEERALLEDVAAMLAGRIELVRWAGEQARARAHLDYVLSAAGAHPYVLALDAGGAAPRWVSPAIEAATGYTPAEALAPDWWERGVHPEDRGRALGAVAAAVAAGAHVHEYRFRHRAGHYRWIRDELRLVRDAEGRPAEIVGTWVDITDRKGAEEALRAAHAELEARVAERTAELTRVNASLRAGEERFRAIFEQAGVGIAELDLGGRWLRVNRQLREIVGYTDAEMRERTFADITHPDDLAADEASFRRMLAGEIGSYQMEKRYVRRDGGLVWVLLTAALVRDGGEAPAYVISVIEDFTERHRATEEVREAQIEVLGRLAAAAEFRDDDTGQHTQRVGELAARLGAALGLAGDRVELLRRAAPLHDVGKIGIPDRILLKPGKLTPEEFEVMRTHTLIGAGILAGGRSALVTMAERIARSHHERWDGAGYPDGLAGADIPLEARLVAVADVFDALTHARPYRPAWRLEDVLALVRDGRGTHFDPAVVDVLLGEALASYLADSLTDAGEAGDGNAHASRPRRWPRPPGRG